MPRTAPARPARSSIPITTTERSPMNPIRTPLSVAAALALCVAGATAASAAGAASHHHDHAASIGVPGKADKVSRTVEVDMTDTMRFNPASIEVKQGETI